MWPYGVVVTAPAFDHQIGFAQTVEDLAIQQLVAQPGIERLRIAIFSWATRSDVGGLATDRRNPALHRLGHELGAIVRTNVGGRP
jgi:hypothetical protein